MPPHAVEAQRLAEQLRARGDHGQQPEPMFDVPAGEPDRLAAVRTAVAEQRAQLAWGTDGANPDYRAGIARAHAALDAVERAAGEG